MKILTKLMLASAVMVTSGFAAEIHETMTIEDGMTADNEACVNIYDTGKLVMKGASGASSNLTIKDQAYVYNGGTVEMHDASAIISTTERNPAFENYGMLDVQKVTDFSNYSAVITSNDDSVIFVPEPGATLSGVAPDDKFIVNVTQEDGEVVKIRYRSSNAKLETDNDSGVVYISLGEEAYEDVEAVSAKTGIVFNDDKSNAVLDPIGKTSMSMDEVINDPVNAEGVESYTFSLDDGSLSSREVSVFDDDRVLHFGLQGEAVDSELRMFGYNELTIRGNCDSLYETISTDGSLCFEKTASKGNINVLAMLSLNADSEIEGNVSAGCVNVFGNITIKGGLHVGWSLYKGIDLVKKSTDIKDYALSSVYFGSIPGYENFIYYQNREEDTESLYYRDSSSGQPDTLMETINLGQFAQTYEDYIEFENNFRVYTASNWWNGESICFTAGEFNGPWDLEFGDKRVIPADNEHAKTFTRISCEPNEGNHVTYNSDPGLGDIKYICIIDESSEFVGIYFDAEQKEWLRMTGELKTSLESISEAPKTEHGDVGEG